MSETMVLLTEKCTERDCGQRVRYSELTDAKNTHWHVKRGVALVPLRSVSSVTDLLSAAGTSGPVGRATK